MVKFRFHRSTLAEAMETVVEVESLRELEELIRKQADFIPWDARLELEYAGYDPRTDWYTFYVLAVGPRERVVVGMTDGEFKDPKEDGGD